MSNSDLTKEQLELDIEAQKVHIKKCELELKKMLKEEKPKRYDYIA